MNKSIGHLSAVISILSIMVNSLNADILKINTRNCGEEQSSNDALQIFVAQQ